MASNSLVSYSAPSSSNVTFYVSNLDSTATHGTAGTFAGAASSTGEVSYPDIVTLFNVSAATASTWFQFYTVPSNDNDNSTGNDIVGVNSSSAPVFSSVNSGVSNATTQTNRNSLQKDFVDTLAEHVFGSREAADLFNNQQTVKASWDTAEAAAVTAANTSMDSASDGANAGDTSAQTAAATLSVNASKEVVEALLVNNSARFGLQYNASLSASGASGNFATGTTSNITPTTSGSGSGAKVTVIMTNASTIQTIMIHNVSDGNAPVTGSGYAKGDSLVITDPAESTNIITIASLNYVQAAMLNGFLDDSSNPTYIPFESGDKIRLKFGVNSASGQTNTAGTAVSFQQSYYVDYQLS
jgi:hypothetical protein